MGSKATVPWKVKTTNQADSTLFNFVINYHQIAKMMAVKDIYSSRKNVYIPVNELNCWTKDIKLVERARVQQQAEQQANAQAHAEQRAEQQANAHAKQRPAQQANAQVHAQAQQQAQSRAQPELPRAPRVKPNIRSSASHAPNTSRLARRGGKVGPSSLRVCDINTGHFDPSNTSDTLSPVSYTHLTLPTKA